eukprot:gene14532-16034_t
MAFEQYMFEEAFDFHDESLSAYKMKSENEPPNERWPPLGAASSDENASATGENNELEENQQILKLEREQEQLNFSLMALTTHFAQESFACFVQFRLKQIVSAPRPQQDKLLRELEDFAFVGCPEAMGPDENKIQCISCTAHMAFDSYDKRLAAEKERQRNLAEQLKLLLDELEKYASKQKETNANLFKDNVQTSKSDKKGFIVEQLRSKLNMSTEEFEAMSSEDMRNQIDKAMAKEHFISQLTTQIKDMEDFVEFLKDNENIANRLNEKINEKQDETTSAGKKVKSTRKKSNDASINTASHSGTSEREINSGLPAPHTKFLQLSEEKRKRLREAGVTVMKKALAVLQIFAISQFGCSAKHFEEHMMRKSAVATAATGYQNALDNLKMSTDRITKLHRQLQELGMMDPDSEADSCPGSPVLRKSWSFARQMSTTSMARSRSSSVSSSDSDITVQSETKNNAIQEEIIREVRNELAPSLKILLQHGLCRTIETSVLSTRRLLGCMSTRTSLGGSMHAWEFFNEFYKMKHGNRFNNQPNVKLSESFGVDLGGTQETPRQTLLTALHKIKSSHEPESVATMQCFERWSALDSIDRNCCIGLGWSFEALN